jgi:hypothetical protein
VVDGFSEEFYAVAAVVLPHPFSLGWRCFVSP